MGFLDTLFNIAAPAAVGFLAGGPAGAAVGGLLGATGVTGGQTTTAVGGGLGGSASSVIASQLGQIATGGAQTTGLLAGVSQANAAALIAAQQPGAGAAAMAGMKNKVITRVQTLNPAGVIIREVILDGRPFLMNNDFVKFTRTKKKIQKAARRLGTRRGATKAEIEHAEKDGLLKGIIAGHHDTARQLTVIDT